MATNRTIALLYDSCLAGHDTARGVGVMDAAFHTLAAALHCAEALADEARVERIKTLADRIRSVIDRDNPGHHLAAANGTERERSTVFASLSRQAEAIGARLRAAHPSHSRVLWHAADLFAPEERPEPRAGILDADGTLPGASPPP